GLPWRGRVGCELAGWQAGQADESEGQPGRGEGQPGRDEYQDGIQVGGITELRLIPDQLVRDGGRQLGLWGDSVVSDRVARAALRVQAMLGHGAVTRPVLAGGRSPARPGTPVAVGDPPA